MSRARLIEPKTAGSGAAQVNTQNGFHRRTVLDPAGATIPKAKVVATETRTGVTHETVTNTTGDYLIADLLPGRYSVSITAAGFKELKSGEIILTATR